MCREKWKQCTFKLVTVDLEVVQGLCDRLLEWSWVGLLGLLDLCGRGEHAHAEGLFDLRPGGRDMSACDLETWV